MKKIILLGVAVLTSCSFLPVICDYSNAIVGSWIRVDHYPSETSFTEVEYLPNGITCSYTLALDNQGVMSAKFYSSRWYVEGNKIELEVLSSNSEYVPVGIRITDEIISVSRDEMTLNMITPLDVSRNDNHYRIVQSDAGRICDVVEAYNKRQQLD